MSINIKCTLLILFSLTLLALAGGCERPPKQVPLPEQPPKAAVLEFTGRAEGWPPQPKGVTDIALVPWEEIPGSLTDSLEAEIRQAALRDTRVRELLGDRFAYISTDEIELEKDRRRDPSQPLATRVTFFSHTNNVAVEVRMLGLNVENVARRQEYQPPEGSDEIATAIDLARRDDRLRDKVQGLNAAAILTFLGQGQPGADHRVLYVTFSKEEEDLPRYFALVDLTEGTVLSAGPLTER